LYVASKFARRHRVATASVLVSVVAVIAALVLTSFAYVRGERLRRLAEEEARRAQAMSKFLEATVFGADPEIGGASLSFLDAISYTSQRIPTDLAEYPRLQADAHELVGFVLRRHGRYLDAESHLRQAYRLRVNELGEDHLATADAMKALGDLFNEYAGRPEEAVSWLERATEVTTRSTDDRTRTCWAHLSLGWGLLHADRAEEARARFDKARAEFVTGFPGVGEAYSGRAIRGLAACALHRGDPEKALTLIDESIERQASLVEMGQEFPLAGAHLTRAEVLNELARYGDAALALDRAEKAITGLLKPGHPLFGRIAIERSRAAFGSGDLDRARVLAQQGEDIFKGSLAPGHWRIHESQAIQRLIESITRKDGPGLDPFTMACDRFQTAIGGTHHRWIWLFRTGAWAYEQRGQTDKAAFMRTIVERRVAVSDR
jgi:tetratricopeptide (TPR) repeat protein